MKMVIYKRSLLLCLAIFLSGCATSPTQLGIPKAQWAQYSQEQKSQIIQGHKATKNKKTGSTDGGSSVLSVKIQGGRVLMAPFTNLQPYQPIAFQIKDGQCGEEIPVEQTNDSHQKTMLGVCYKNYTLFLDPSAYDPDQADGSLQFQYMPIWKRGFTYPKVTSTGFAKLTDVNIWVREIVSGDK